MFRPERLLVARPVADLEVEITREMPGSDRVVLSIIRDHEYEVEYSVHDSVKAARTRAFEVLQISIDWREPPQSE